MSNPIPTINIIPEDYEGNPRDALGYAWTDLDARNAQHPGYCTKCHSYCYGDCECERDER